MICFELSINYNVLIDRELVRHSGECDQKVEQRSSIDPFKQNFDRSGPKITENLTFVFLNLGCEFSRS
jgi:hypothetical protein